MAHIIWLAWGSWCFHKFLCCQHQRSGDANCGDTNSRPRITSKHRFWGRFPIWRLCVIDSKIIANMKSRITFLHRVPSGCFSRLIEKVRHYLYPLTRWRRCVLFWFDKNGPNDLLDLKIVFTEPQRNTGQNTPLISKFSVFLLNKSEKTILAVILLVIGYES